MTQLAYRLHFTFSPLNSHAEVITVTNILLKTYKHCSNISQPSFFPIKEKIERKTPLKTSDASPFQALFHFGSWWITSLEPCRLKKRVKLDGKMFEEV